MRRTHPLSRWGALPLAASFALASGGCGGEASPTPTQAPAAATATPGEPTVTEAAPTDPPATATAADPGGTPTGTPQAGFTLSSPTLVDGEALPLANKCERDGGEGLSPPLSWSGAPEGTVSYALTMHHFPQGTDPEVDTPSSYWLVWNIPEETTSLSQGNVESVGTEGSDKDGVQTGYTPPCAPDGATHWYTLTVFALSAAPTSLGTEDSVDIDYVTVRAAIDPLTLGTATLTFSN